MGRGASEMGNRCNSTNKDVEGETAKIQRDANGDEFTVVLLELNGNPGQTFQLKRDLEQLLPQALQEHICGLASLPDSWNRKYLRESDLVLSIGDAAISDEMSLHQNGVTDGTVITVAISDAAPGRWQQMKEQQAERFLRLGRDGHVVYAVREAAAWAGSSTLSSSATTNTTNSERLLDHCEIG